MGIEGPLRRDLLLPDVPGEAEKDAHAQLVVQEAGFDIAGSRDPHIRLEADEVPHGDAQLFRVLLRAHVLVQHDLAGVPVPLCAVVFAVHMDGGVAQLEGALIDAAEFRHDTHVLRLGVVGIHAAEIGEPEPPAALDLRHHAAQGVQMGFQEQAVFPVRAAEGDQHAPLVGALCLKAQLPEFLQHPGRRLFRVAGGGVDVQQGLGFLHKEIRVLFQRQLVHFRSSFPDACIPRLF